MSEKLYGGLSLFSRYGNRKYLNAAERLRFLDAARCAPHKARQFCLTLGYSGARISEVLALTPLAVDLENGTVNIRTLKRRQPNIVRQVPLPSCLLEELDAVFAIRERQQNVCLAHERIWRFGRTTGWRYVKRVMALAQIIGTPAMPKGLRHAFGVNAFQSNVPPHLVQRWLGHASLETTTIYCDVVGPDERDFAKRMW